jgi:hypothetical protein
MTPEERARSLLLPFSDGTAVLVPSDPVPDAEPSGTESASTDTVPSTIEYLEDPTADLFMLDGSSWRYLDETSKLASNTSSFSFVVDMDGLVSLNHTDTVRLLCLVSQLVLRSNAVVSCSSPLGR